METNWTKLLSNNANKLSVIRLRAVAFASRSVLELHRLAVAHATLTKKHAKKLHRTMLRRLAAYRNVAALTLSSVSTAMGLHEISGISGRAQREAVRLVEPVRVSVEDHWRRAVGVVTVALESFQRIKSLHTSAARQLDSADYALTQLLHDLRPVMGLPADVSGLRAVLAEAERSAPERRRKALAAA